jgi:hypothetical protein
VWEEVEPILCKSVVVPERMEPFVCPRGL